MNLNFNQLWRYQDDFLHGIQTTLTLTLVATVAGMLIGLAGALLSNNRQPAVRLAVRTYVEIIRNTPALIQIFLIFFVLPYAGLRLPPFEAAAVALSIYMGAYAVEIFRSGLASIPKSQIEAGLCLGLTQVQLFRYVILLPALRNVYPSLASQIILILLGSSLASQVSADELFHTAAFVESRTYRSFEVYAVVCAIYFVMVLSLRLIFAGVERIAFRWPTRR